ncbi:DUF1616 domain-containing protein [Natrialbaceae archaeon A-arb3/5]
MKDRSTHTLQPFTAVRQGSKHLAAQLPTDLVGTAGFVLAAVTLLAVVDVSSTLVRAAIGFPLLILVPGYATVSVLFPRSAAANQTRDESTLLGRDGVTNVERAALAFGVSVAVLPLLGLLIAASPWGYATPVVVATVAGYSLLALGAAAVRRLRLPPGERYRFSLRRSVGAVHAAIFDTKTTVHTGVNVLLAVSLLVALTTVGYALVAPQQGEQYTSLEVLTEDESGDLVASDYAGNVTAGESLSLTVGVENQEGADREYAVVIQEQWISDGEVIDRTDANQTEYAVDDGESVRESHDVTPAAESGDVRIAVLLYEDGDVPDTPTTDNAYRYGYVWTEVVDGE